MNIVHQLLITAYLLIVMSFAQYPIWIVKKAYSNTNTDQNHNTLILSSIAVSALILFVVFSNIITLYTGFELLEQKVFEYISILYGVILIALVSWSVYYIIGDYIISNELNYRRNAIRIITIIIIFIALLFLYSIIIANSEVGANYVELSNNYIMPLFTCILIVPLIIDIIQKRSIKAILNTKSILILAAIIISLVDLIIIKNPSIQLIILLYGVYAAHIYRNISCDKSGNQDVPPILYTKSQFMKEHNLSEREMEVIILACKGQTNNEIADNLILSPHTVKSHMKHIFTKLNIDSRHKLQSIISQVNLNK